MSTPSSHIRRLNKTKVNKEYGMFVLNNNSIDKENPT